MYQIEKTPFGTFEKYRVWNEKSGNSFTFVPGYGANLLDIQIQGQSVIETYETSGQLIANRWMKNNILAPFPNRLKMGTYNWNGTSYRLFLNDPITHNAMHGFVMDKKWEITQKGFTQEHAIISCAYEYDGAIEGYPFPFTLEVTYLMKEPNAFEVKLNFQNDGDATIPVGLGWHPYFQITDHIDTMKIQLPTCEMIGVDEFMIPTGKSYEYNDYETLKELGANILDNCFVLKETLQKRRCYYSRLHEASGTGRRQAKGNSTTCRSLPTPTEYLLP